MNNYIKPRPSEWIGRIDNAKKERVHQIVQCIDISKPLTKKSKKAFGFVGFASDEGILRNKGRPGAKLGPDAFRESSRNIAVHGNYELIDFGDVECNGDLENAQKTLSLAVQKILDANIHPIIIGGGHEVTFGHFLGLEKMFNDKECWIVNFDAHFDLRDVQDNKGTSGTSFTQIADCLKEKNVPFNYACLGIQENANTNSLQKKAKELNVKSIGAEDFHLNQGKNADVLIDEIVKKAKVILLTICLDVFASPYAPGVSARGPLGLLPWHILPLLKRLAASGKVASLDIAELSPPNDVNHQTAALASALVFQYIHAIK